MSFLFYFCSLTSGVAVMESRQFDQVCWFTPRQRIWEDGDIKVHPASTAVRGREPCKPAHHAGGCSDVKQPHFCASHTSASSLPPGLLKWCAHTHSVSGFGNLAELVEWHPGILKMQSISIFSLSRQPWMTLYKNHNLQRNARTVGCSMHANTLK